MKQSRRASLVESLLNVAIGYGIAIASQMAIWFGIHISVADNIIIGLLFTVVSIVRSFALRRMFETLRVRGKLS